jgi:hypothetical protein
VQHKKIYARVAVVVFHDGIGIKLWRFKETSRFSFSSAFEELGAGLGLTPDLEVLNVDEETRG